jgi:hypothetical protein
MGQRITAQGATGLLRAVRLRGATATLGAAAAIAEMEIAGAAIVGAVRDFMRIPETGGWGRISFIRGWTRG